MERKVKRYFAKLTRWGANLGLRIPCQLVRKFQLSDSEEVLIAPEKEGFSVKKIKSIEREDNYCI